MNRISPLTTDTPICDRARPRNPLIKPLIRLPSLKDAMMVSPKRASQKNSAGPNKSANSASGGANHTKTAMPKSPPKTDAKHAMERALPPSPFLAMGKPSNVVVMDCGVPGVLTRIAAKEPP